MSSEIWRSIENYPYEVSDRGQVLSHIFKRVRLLKPGLNSRGYAYVQLWREGQGKTFLVHRLVLTTFRGPPFPGAQANHINGTKADNRLVNLEWVTHSENGLHSRRVLGQAIGSKQGSAKLTEEDVPQIRKLLKEGVILRVIGTKFGVGKTAIWMIAAGKRWIHVPVEP